MQELSIIIPAYNEENRIRKTLEEYSIFFSEKCGDNFEIIVVLNGCKDDTLGVVKSIAKKNKQIIYLDIKEAIGKGGAVTEGFKMAEGGLIGFVDADNSTKPEAFYDLVRNIGGHDCIIASRWIKGAKVSPKQPINRRIASRIFNIMTRILFGIKVWDSQCGAKLFKKEVIKSVINNLGITRWAFDVDLLYQLKKKKYSVYEIPTVWNDSEGSKLDVKKASVEMFLAIARLRLIYSPLRFIVRIYDKLK